MSGASSEKDSSGIQEDEIDQAFAYHCRSQMSLSSFGVSYKQTCFIIQLLKTFKNCITGEKKPFRKWKHIEVEFSQIASN